MSIDVTSRPAAAAGPTASGAASTPPGASSASTPGTSGAGAPGVPSVQTLMARAAGLRPALAERAAETERGRRVSAESMTLLRDQELLRMTQPARFGGFGYGPSTLVRLGYELGQACGSTAWCAALSNCNSWFASYWPLEAQQDVWGDDRDTLITAPLAPTGKCSPVDGGFHLWGTWPYASNCENSQWAIIAAVIPEGPGGPPGPAWFLAPMTTLRIDQDTWHMSGMQGTGSKTLVADEPVFVPAHRMVRLADVFGGTTPGTAIPDNPLAGFGWSTFGASALIGPMLGMARGTLDWFTENMRSKVRPGAAASAAHSPLVQEKAGMAEASLDAALQLVLAGLDSAEDTIFSGKPLDEAGRVCIRRNFGYAAHQVSDVVTTLYGASGSGAAQLDRPIQRHWRDAAVAAGHVSLDTSAIMAMTGQLLFGLQPTGAH